MPVIYTCILEFQDVFRREGGAVAPPARARVSKAVGKRFEGSLVGRDAERH